MSNMSFSQLRRLDMTLLLVFASILRHRKLTHAARELGLSQSAVSHALNRLREIFGDTLFLRRQTGMEPTARALALEPGIARILDLATDALKHETRFDPSTDTRTIRLGAQEYMSAVLAGALNMRMEKLAPKMRVVMEAGSSREIFNGLANNALDLAVTSYHDIPRQFLREKLYEEPYMVAARKRHPLIGKQLTRAAYLRCEHVLVTNTRNPGGRLETSFAAAGVTRNVTMVMPFFLGALAAIRDCDRVLTLPKSLAGLYAGKFGVDLYPIPIPLPKFEVSLVFHPRSERDPALTWFRTQIRALAAER